MKTSILVLNALFAPCGAIKFLPTESLEEPVPDNSLLEIGTNVRAELQNSLRSFLNDDGEKIPGAANKAVQKFERAARKTELRFGKRVPYERFPNWVLPGSEPIMPKKSADLNLWDDELDPKQSFFHYKPRWDATRAKFLQLDSEVAVDSEQEAQIREEVSTSLRSFLEGPNAKHYPYDKYPNVVLPGSTPIMPKASGAIDLYDGAMTNDWHKNHRSTYDARTHDYGVHLAQAEGPNAKKYPYDKFPNVILPGSVAIMPKASAPIDLYDHSMTDDWHKNHRSPYNKRTHNWKAHYPAAAAPAAFVQLDSNLSDAEITVEEARLQAAQMQAQMDKAVADADQKRAAQQAQYEANINNNDPSAQLQGLMNAQQSLHRLTSAFSAKPNLDKVTGMAQKLGIPMTPELMQLGSNEAISNALVEIAVGMGKSEAEIEQSLNDM